MAIQQSVVYLLYSVDDGARARLGWLCSQRLERLSDRLRILIYNLLDLDIVQCGLTLQVSFIGSVKLLLVLLGSLILSLSFFLLDLKLLLFTLRLLSCLVGGR